MKNFSDILIKKIQEKGTPICMGLDPILNKIPASIVVKAENNHGPTLIAAAEALLNFNKGLIDAVSDLVPVIKPQIAYYEMYGYYGIWAFEETCKYARENGMLVLADVKRGDIGSTAEAYARAYLGKVDVFGNKQHTYEVDAVTINPYMGYDTVKPFIEQARKYGKGTFILVKTSNVSSGDFQDRVVDESGLKVHEVAAHLVESWGSDDIGQKGYSSVGAVVGATYPAELKKLRELMPSSYFLIPGYGAQGGTAKDVAAAFDSDGLGAIINSSRGICFAYEADKSYSSENFAEAARAAVLEMKEDLAEHI
jgi:orotidine-5'-phosphate decarboxylase